MEECGGVDEGCGVGRLLWSGETAKEWKSGVERESAVVKHRLGARVAEKHRDGRLQDPRHALHRACGEAL